MSGNFRYVVANDITWNKKFHLFFAASLTGWLIDSIIAGLISDSPMETNKLTVALLMAVFGADQIEQIAADPN